MLELFLHNINWLFVFFSKLIGDSGGGIFGNENGRQIVYGATSYGDAVCQSGVRGKSVNANIHFLLSEIDSLLKECA